VIDRLTLWNHGIYTREEHMKGITIINTVLDANISGVNSVDILTNSILLNMKSGKRFKFTGKHPFKFSKLDKIGEYTIKDILAFLGAKI